MNLDISCTMMLMLSAFIVSSVRFVSLCVGSVMQAFALSNSTYLSEPHSYKVILM